MIVARLKRRSNQWKPIKTVFRLDPRRLQLEKFHSRKPIESLSDIKLEKERETGRVVENAPMPLPLSISLPLVGQSSVCTWTRAFARANATGNFAFPLCRLLDKQQRQGGVIHWHRYTGPAASQKTPLIRERPANPPLPLSLSLESPFAK